MTDVAPDLTKLTDAELADAYGRQATAAKAGEAQANALKAELARRGKSQYLGLAFTVVRSAGEQNRFNSAAAIAEMGQAWYDKFKRATPVVSWIVSVSDASTAALAALTPAARKRRKTAPAA